MFSGRVVKTLQTFPCVGVAISRFGNIDVIIALAFFARSSDWVTKVVIGADFAQRSRVAFLAVADDIFGFRVELAAVRVAALVGVSLGPGAGARAARDVHAEARVAVEPFHTPLTAVALREVITLCARTGPVVTFKGVSVTITLLTVGEVEVAGLTEIARTSVCIRSAFTLTACGVTEVV